MIGKPWTITLGRLFIAAALSIVTGLAIWEALYHDPSEPKDLRYQAWKLGIYSMDLDKATSTMVQDTFRDRLVVGKTKEELIRRFGYVTTLDRTSEYIKYCYANSPYYGRPVLYLRRSNWQVVMKDNRAESLVLVKGC